MYFRVGWEWGRFAWGWLKKITQKERSKKKRGGGLILSSPLSTVTPQPPTAKIT
jgi:hypothetical protein